MPQAHEQANTSHAPRLKQLTPILIVESVEPAVDFWVERFAFSKENEVPGPDGRLVFASVQRDGIEIMYQSRASVIADGSVAEHELTGHTVALFFTVENLDQVEKAVAGAEIVKPRHETFYGTAELYIKEPGGNTVGFAQHL